MSAVNTRMRVESRQKALKTGIVRAALSPLRRAVALPVVYLGATTFVLLKIKMGIGIYSGIETVPTIF